MSTIAPCDSSHRTRTNNWPTTDRGWHDLYVSLDRQYGTAAGSPLHHDNRCPLCGVR